MNLPSFCFVRALGLVWGSGLTPVKSCCFKATNVHQLWPQRLSSPLKWIWRWLGERHDVSATLERWQVWRSRQSCLLLFSWCFASSKTVCPSTKVMLVGCWMLLMLLGYDHNDCSSPSKSLEVQCKSMVATIVFTFLQLVEWRLIPFD